MYEKAKNIDGSIDETTIVRLRDGALIPVDDENIDYQQYLVWKQANQSEGE